MPASIMLPSRQPTLDPRPLNQDANQPIRCAARYVCHGVACRLGLAQGHVRSMQVCEDSPQPAFCKAVGGERANGWPAQSRAEVRAQHGMVVTSQPLAAQAGLQTSMRGGIAIDAAVTTATILFLWRPTGVVQIGWGETVTRAE